MAGFFVSLFYEIIKEGRYSSKQDLYFFGSFFGSYVIVGLLLSLYYWRRKEIKELTPEAKEKIKKQEEEFVSKWYVRYPVSVFALGWGYVCYKAYINGLDLNIIINPVIGVVMVIVAIFRAWEISLIVIAGVVLYYTYLGIAALPVSVAIIVGSIIIAYGIYKYKA